MKKMNYVTNYTYKKINKGNINIFDKKQNINFYSVLTDMFKSSKNNSKKMYQCLQKDFEKK